MDPSDERRLTSVEVGLSTHERQCAERMGEIRGELKEMRDDMKAATKFQSRTLLGILLALVAFGAKEVWVSRGGLAGGAAIAVVAHD